MCDDSPVTEHPGGRSLTGEKVIAVIAHRLMVGCVVGCAASVVLGAVGTEPPESVPSVCGTPVACSSSVVVDPPEGDAQPDDLQLVAASRRHTRVTAVRLRGDVDQILVDVNPTRPSTYGFYRVVLKVRHRGEWVRCAPIPGHVYRARVARTFNMWGMDWARGRGPHEVAAFYACKHKPNHRYRVVVPAQHGLLRTVATPTNA